MTLPDRPQLRLLSGRRAEHQGESFVALEDPIRAFDGPALIRWDLFRDVVGRFDGGSTLIDIRRQVADATGRTIPPDDLERLVESLDRAMVIEGPTFAAYLRAYAELPSRPAALAGRSYPDDPVALRGELARMFDHPAGAGRPTPGARGSTDAFRGILAPHIDFGRGGPTYTWAYRELVERSEADVFVVLGVAHKPCRRRFVLTRKDFETPLGPAKCDRAFVDHVADRAGPEFFEDELAHRSEHSIEFQAVFLRYLLGDRRDFRIVPILVGSFHDLMGRGVDPIDDPEVRRMVEALRSAEAATGKKVAYVGGIDLCHVGPEFGDPRPVDDATLGQVLDFDRAMLDRAEAVDPAGWFATASAVGDRWRVCGLAAAYTMMHAIGPSRGRLLRHDRALNPSRTCCVTFASLAYDAEPAAFASASAS